MGYYDEDESLPRFFKELRKIPLELDGKNLWNKEEFNELLERQRKTGSKDLKNRLLEANLRFVASRAKRYLGKGLTLLELISEGYIGMNSAYDRFDAKWNTSFISYAVWWIDQTMSKAIAEKGGVIRLTVHAAEDLANLKKHYEIYLKKFSREPTEEELSEFSRIPLARVKRMAPYMEDILSLDYSLGDEENTTLQEIIDDDNAALEFKNLEERMDSDRVRERARQYLTPREYSIIVDRNGLNGNKPLTLQEIGNKHNLTRERVRQIYNKVLKRVREKEGIFWDEEYGNQDSNL